MILSTPPHLTKYVIAAGMLVCFSLTLASCGGGGGSSSPAGVSPGASSDSSLILSESGDAEAPTLQDAPDANANIEAMKKGETFDTDTVSQSDIDQTITDESVESSAPLTGASGGPSVNDYYTPAKAFDGNYNSWWAGAVNEKRWALYYAFEKSYYIDKMDLNFYTDDFAPKHVFVFISTDGVHWSNRAHIMAKKYHQVVEINRQVKYIKVVMKGKPTSGFPLVRDIAWLPFVEKTGTYATPGANDIFYNASYAFDGKSDTQWVGQKDNGSWDVYYNFSEPRMVGGVTATMPSINYRPQQMNVLISDDGLNWTLIGDMATTYPPSKFVGLETQHVKLELRGNPASGFPYIHTIAFDFPDGANSPHCHNENFWPASKAFDGDSNSEWTGTQGLGEWDLFYKYPSPQYIGLLAMSFHDGNYRPEAITAYVSDDGVTWTEAGSLGVDAPSSLFVDKTASHLWLKMTGNPASQFPLVREVTTSVPTGAMSPDSVSSFYTASKAFDGDMNTWWAGEPEKGTWQMFYGFGTPTALGDVAVHFYAQSHTTPSTKLYLSDDGVSWTLAGTFEAGEPPTLSVNATASYMRLDMAGNPGIGYPLIKDISW